VGPLSIVMIGRSCEGAALYVGSKTCWPEKNLALKWYSMVLLSTVML
jgi:hypothetical protein